MMKKFAKLVLFFSLSFAIIFIAAIFFRLLSSWVDYVRVIPVGAMPGENAVDAAWKALPIALYLSILLSLSYSARQKTDIILSIAGIGVLCFVFVFCLSLGLNRAESLGPALKPVAPIRGEPGLVLTQLDTTIVLLKQSSDIQGPRLVSISGQPFIYQEVPWGPNNTILSLPNLPFADNTPWFIRSMDIDLSLSAREIKNRQQEGFFPLIAYLFSLIVCLASMRFLMELSKWPLANLFLGFLVFRLILALEVFVNSREISTLIGAFLTARVPATLATPLVFCAIGVLVLIYTLITRIASRAGSKKGGDE